MGLGGGEDSACKFLFFFPDELVVYFLQDECASV